MGDTEGHRWLAEWRIPLCSFRVRPPIGQAIHWPAPPTHTSRLFSNSTRACSFNTGQEVALYLGKPALLHSEAGEGLSRKAEQLRVETSISVQ